MQLEGYRVRRVTLDDAPTLQALLALDPAYYETVEGAPLRPDEAAELIAERPPGVPPERKHDLLVEAPRASAPLLTGGAALASNAALPGPPAPHAPAAVGATADGADFEPVAVLSFLEGFPDERTWYLGQIFIAPAARGRGLGTRALEALCAHVRERGGAALRLAVVTTHTDARRLYDRLGFAFVARRPRTGWNGVVREVDVLERALRGS